MAAWMEAGFLCDPPRHRTHHLLFPNIFCRLRGGLLTESVSRQLFPVVEESMLQPLWESRDRYEELKQIDDALTEVSVASRASRHSGLRPHCRRHRGGPWGRALIPPKEKAGNPTWVDGIGQRCPRMGPRVSVRSVADPASSSGPTPSLLLPRTDLVQ